MRLLLSSIPYAAFLQYSKVGGDASTKSVRAQGRVKRGDKEIIEDIAGRIKQACLEGEFSEYFYGKVTLVPVPGSSPRKDKNALWVPKLICEALLGAGLGTNVDECLHRVTAVKKSAYQARGERPTPQEHYDSFRVETSLIRPEKKIVVVDDFITRGRTMMAACSRVQEAFPSHDIKAFGIFRTIGFREIDTVIMPFEGEILFDGEDANRGD